MISVLIPIYMWDCEKLINDVLASSNSMEEEVEILVCDDHSPDRSYYESLISRFESIVEVKIWRNEFNLGRSATRNYLVSKSKFAQVVFIDGDSRLWDAHSYISNFIKFQQHDTIVVGGTLYQDRAPESKRRLHWKYGRTRETKSIELRRQEPLRYFFSNNFSCSRTLLMANPFDEKMKRYGYEDSLWAADMQTKGVKIHHIENYVIHKGLNTNNKFLSNAKAAVRTLFQLSEKGHISQVKLHQFYDRKSKQKFGKILLYLAGFIQPMLEKLLLLGFHNLKVFDLFRLGELYNLHKKH